MSTPIKRIVISELDLTTAARLEDSLDVVYVPGLYGTRYISFDANTNPRTISLPAEVGDEFVIIAKGESEKTPICKAFICTLKETNDNLNEEGETIYDWMEIDFVAPFLTVYNADGTINVAKTQEAVQKMNKFTMAEPTKCTTVTELAQFGEFYKSNMPEMENRGSSIDYAAYVINAGLPVVYHCGAKFEMRDNMLYEMTARDEDMYATLDAELDNSCFNEIADVNEFDVKYITSGVYSVGEKQTGYHVNMLNNMLSVAEHRGDAMALIDSGIEQSVNPEGSLWTALNDAPVQNGKYAGAFAPWGYYQISGGNTLMPPSFGYLLAFADSIKTNGSNMAIAGTTRGIVPMLKSLNLPSGERLSNAIADSWQAVDETANVNAITNIRNYGLCLWGNRTLHNNASTKGLVDSSFLNIRNMLCDIKKTARNVALRLLFEQNDDVLWSEFLFGITPILERLKSTAGIASYKIVKIPTDDKSKLKAVIKIVTVKALEQVEIAVVMTDSDVSVE